jgi:hypothetical protein
VTSPVALMSSRVPAMFCVIVDCWAAAADGSAAEPSISAQKSTFFIFSFPKAFISARTLARAPWLFAERLRRD